MHVFIIIRGVIQKYHVHTSLQNHVYDQVLRWTDAPKDALKFIQVREWVGASKGCLAIY